MWFCTPYGRCKESRVRGGKGGRGIPFKGVYDYKEGYRVVAKGALRLSGRQSFHSLRRPLKLFFYVVDRSCMVPGASQAVDGGGGGGGMREVGVFVCVFLVFMPFGWWRRRLGRF